MEPIKKKVSQLSDLKIEDDYVVSDIQKIDHWLLFGIGILPFLISSIWYSLYY